MFLRRPWLLVLRTAKCITCVRTSYLCTAAETQRLPDPFRTSEADPTNHTMNHEGKFYTIDTETTSSLFKLGGLNDEFRSQGEAFNETCLMVRKPALEVIHYLKNANYQHPPIRYVLYSQYIGAGMTMTLSHIMHYTWLQKWLIVYVPDAMQFTKSWKGNVTQSTFNPSRRDNNLEAANWLKHFQAQNADLLSQIKLTKTYVWSKRETSEIGDPLGNVVQHGLNRMSHASDCLAVVLKEVKSQSGPNSFRTLVVIDGLNSFFRPCHYKVLHRFIEMDELTIVRSFKELLTNDWNNAAIVVSADMKAHTDEPYVTKLKPDRTYYPEKNPGLIAKRDIWAPLPNSPNRIKKGKFKKTFDPKFTRTRMLPYTPWELLGKEGTSLLDPFVPIEVTKYNPKELESCLDYYCDRQYIQNEKGASDEGRQELIFLSGGIPGDLYRFCAPV